MAKWKSFLLISGFLLGNVIPAIAITVPVDNNVLITEHEAEPISEIDMDKLRGGFIDPTGLIYSFAVNIQTMLNGMEVFSRSVTLAQSTNGPGLQLQSNTNLNQQNIPNNVSVNLLNDNKGLVVTDQNGGTTTVLNQTGAGIPSSIILNTAGNRDVSQSINVELALQSLPAIKNQLNLTNPGGAIREHAALHSLGF